MKKLFLILLTVCLASTLIAQSKVEKALQTLDAHYPPEKVHLFFNQEQYVAGETMWFKAYVFSGYVQSYISTNLYVELYNAQKSLLDKTLLPLVDAVGHGSITLPSNLPEGIYYVRAYTKWMLNSDKDFEYLLPIAVYNPASKQRLAAPAVKWTAAFYPESGTVLGDVENNIAVRLKAEGSLPSKWTGYITEKQSPQNKLLHFSSLNEQVASFSFTPAAGKEYTVHLQDSLGNKAALSLTPSTKGVVLKAGQIEDRLHLDMTFRGFPQGGQNFRLVAQMQGQLVYSAKIQKSDTHLKASIPVGKLMNGVLHLTLFNEGDEAIAERLVYIHNDPNPTLSLSTPTLSTKQRGKNEWQLAIDSAQLFSYAVSITDASLTTARKRSLLSDLYLGDFTSIIHNPASYFRGSTASLKALDALLITEKWSRFNWKEVLANSFAKIIYQPEKYLSYRGTAKRNGKAVVEEGLTLMLRFKDSSTQFTGVKTDKTGGFTISDVAFYDTVTVYYKGSTAKAASKEVELTFESKHSFVPFTGTLPTAPYVLVPRSTQDSLPLVIVYSLQALKNQTAANDGYIQLGEVKVNTTAKSAAAKLNEQLASPLFQTESEVIFDFINEAQGTQGYQHIFDWLDGRVAGLSFTIKGEGASESPSTAPLNRISQRIPIMRDGEVALFVDEMPTDIDMVYSLPMSQIAMVKVIKGSFMGAAGSGGGNGAIAIYTNQGSLGKKGSAPATPSAILAGYRKVAPYEPMQYMEERIRAVQKDTRVELLWSSNLQDKGGKVPLQFYNSDSTTAFGIVITGFSKDAKPVYIEEVIQLKNK
jgi:hypothetical protein